ncbi:MAG: right-handed parallel beta-helix repeat-containing protein [Acidimicrobiales bacterium]
MAADVVPDLQSLIDAVPDGATLTLSGDIVVNEAVLIDNRNDLAIVGDGTTVLHQAAGAQVKMLLVVGGSNITICDLELAGSRVPTVKGGSGGAGIGVKGTSGVTLENLYVHDTWGDFVDLDIGLRGDPDLTTRDVLITGNRFERSGRQGVSISRMIDNVDIVANTMVDSNRATIDIEHSITTNDILIDQNVIQNFGTAGVIFGRGGVVTNVVVQRNTVTTGSKALWVNVLERDPANQVRGLTVCNDVLESDFAPNDLVGATEIYTNEPFISDEPVQECPALLP